LISNEIFRKLSLETQTQKNFEKESAQILNQNYGKDSIET
jgi:hypothetical protein